jgi:glycine/D-amino acid oxidase-like deaminating enzyme
MKTRYGVSPWIDAVPVRRRPSHPKWRGEEAVDVLIVGGGLTGCATAHALAQAGARVVLVEADRLGQGATGHAPGLLLPEPGPPFLDVQHRYGLRAARAMFEMWRRASLDAAALLRRAAIRCGLQPVDAVRWSGAGGERALRRDYDGRSSAGLDVSWLATSPMRRSIKLDGVAMRMPGAFVFDPYRACLGLASAARKRGVRLFERSPVKKLRASARHVEVVLEGGSVQAGTVILATGIPGPELKPLRRHFTIRTRYLAMTEPVPPAVRRQMMPAEVMLRDDSIPAHWLRWAADHRLLVAGADEDDPPRRAPATVLPQRTGQLMYEALLQYPVISGLRPEYGWEVSSGDTADDLMYIGAHRNFPRHLFALGGDSSTGAFLAARILARAALGEPRKGDELFGWTR